MIMPDSITFQTFIKLKADTQWTKWSDPSPTKSSYLKFQPVKVVSRYRDPQPQEVENYSFCSI